jgi:hypothetical protein
MDRKTENKPKNEDKSTLSAIYRIKDENIKKMNEYLNKNKDGK